MAMEGSMVIGTKVASAWTLQTQNVGRITDWSGVIEVTHRRGSKALVCIKFC